MADNKKNLDDALILREWLDSIPRGVYNATVQRLVERCAVSPDTYANWRRGLCRIPEAKKEVINTLALEVSGKEIFK